MLLVIKESEDDRARRWPNTIQMTGHRAKHQAENQGQRLNSKRMRIASLSSERQPELLTKATEGGLGWGGGKTTRGLGDEVPRS